VLLQPTASTPNFYDLTIDGYVEYTYNDPNVERNLIISTGKKFMSTTNGLQLSASTSDLQVESGARYEASNLAVFAVTGSSISKNDGYIDAIVYLLGQHVGPTDSIAPGSY